MSPGILQNAHDFCGVINWLFQVPNSQGCKTVRYMQKNLTFRLVRVLSYGNNSFIILRLI